MVASSGIFRSIFAFLRRASLQRVLCGGGAAVGDLGASVAEMEQRRACLRKALAFLTLHLLIAAAPSWGVNPTSDPATRAPYHVSFMSNAIHGHVLPLLSLADELRRRGHRVSFATHDNIRSWIEDRDIEFVSLGPFPLNSEEYRQRRLQFSQEASPFRGILTLLNDVYVPLVQGVPAAASTKYTNDRPDVLIVDVSTLTGVNIADQLSIPVIVNSPTFLFELQTSTAHLPSWGTGFTTNMSIWDRCVNLLFPRLLSVALTPLFMHFNKLRVQHGLFPFFAQDDIYMDTPIMVNTIPQFDYPRKIHPMVTYTGPLLGVDSKYAEAKGTAVNSHHSGSDIPPLIQAWLQGRSYSRSSLPVAPADYLGVILVNLGNLPVVAEAQVQAMLEAFSVPVTGTGSDGTITSSHFRVLWLRPDDQRDVYPDTLPPNVRVRTLGRLPHTKILEDDAVKVVISHCGMSSAQDALVAGKPLICVPFVADQFDVGARIQDHRAGLTLAAHSLTAQALSDAISRLFTDPSYNHNARRLGKLLRTAGGVTVGADLVETLAELGLAHLVFYPHKSWPSQTLDIAAMISAVVCIWVLHVYGIYSLIAYNVRRWTGYTKSPESSEQESDAQLSQYFRAHLMNEGNVSDGDDQVDSSDFGNLSSTMSDDLAVEQGNSRRHT